MTSTTPAPDTAPDSLARWLSSRPDTELAAALHARPDLVVPPPATMAVLASRAQQRASVFRAADDLTTADFGIIAGFEQGVEALQDAGIQLDPSVLDAVRAVLPQ